jgi:tRNA A-37 threonylcarbamoyl transferase component Bud32
MMPEYGFCGGKQTRWWYRLGMRELLDGVVSEDARLIESHDNLERIQNRHGRGSLVVVREMAGFDGLFVKHYAPRSWVEYIKYLLNPTRARAEWRASVRLLKYGIPSAQPIALGETRVFGVWCRSILVMEALIPRVPLGSYLRSGHLKTACSRRSVRLLAGVVARLHDNRLVHRDLHSDNILLKLEEDEIVQFFVADLHEMRQISFCSWRGCVMDLARLNVTVELPNRYRLVFLVEYLAARGIDASELRRWICAVQKGTQAIRQHNRRKVLRDA